MPEVKAKQNKQLVEASARHLRIAPRKMRLVTNMVKGMHVLTAIHQLQHTNKKASLMLVKLLKSAVANAQNNFSLQPEQLYIKSLTTDMGKVMKRYMPRARGSAFTIKRKMCHVNVVLEARTGGKAVKSKFQLFKKQQEKTAPSVDQEIATTTKPAKTEGRRSQVGKTEDQVKQNKVQQKRRLFNRKSGV